MEKCGDAFSHHQARIKESFKIPCIFNMISCAVYYIVAAGESAGKID